MNNIGQYMKQAQQLQNKMTEIQEKMVTVSVEGSAGAGLVTATVNGKGKLKKIKLDHSLIDPNEIEMLEDLIVAAINDACQKAETQLSTEMNALTGGLQLPGNLKMPF